ncbi:MAG: ribonuclease HI [Betaproteobacteria bacterium]|nr:ribonuclease HI [Betaproteobacteria bacterium]
MKIIDIYTDGACSGNPGPGGWGAVLKSGSHEKEIWGSDPQTTNNRMEILAVIRALEQLKRKGMTVKVHTDSQYVQKGISEWIHGWKVRGWLTSGKAPVKNADLWRLLDEIAALHTVEWCWVKGHAGHPGNERADALARRGVEAVRNHEPERVLQQ